jgi:K+-transporting ATPase KdpF subunit
MRVVMMIGLQQGNGNGCRRDPPRHARVRADVRPHQGFGADMSGADVFGLVVALLVFGYLVYALLRGERL